MSDHKIFCKDAVISRLGQNSLYNKQPQKQAKKRRAKVLTICIAAMGKDEFGNEFIVFATDHMISIDDLGQFEKTIEKYKKINNNTVVMLAGRPLFFNDLIAGCEKKGCAYDEIKVKLFENIKKKRDERIQKEILDIYKIDFNYITEILKEPNPNRFQDDLLQSIADFNLETGVILVGFRDTKAEISEIDEFGTVDFRDIDFDCIGTGSVQAVNTLMFQRHSKNDSLPVTLYNVYKAKRNAEVCIGVGEETDIGIVTLHEVKKLSPDQMEILKGVYNREIEFGKNDKNLNEMAKTLIGCEK